MSRRRAPWPGFTPSLLAACLLAGCAGAVPAPDDGVDAGTLRQRDGFTDCAEPRPEICTQEYVPVCGLRATTMECVAAPCEGAFERVTKSNRCMACADAEVVGWVPGACDADPVDSPLYLDP